MTGTDGQASVTATAGTIAGSYTVTASAAGATAAASFGLTNAPGAAASVAVLSGSGQTATVATEFDHPLVAVVTDAYGNPVPGVSVTFAAPASGASATLTGSPAVTGADGQASVTATAGTIAGSYTVTASAAGASTTANFGLTNAPGAAASVAVVSGSGQTTTVATGFAHPLVAAVTDAYGNPVPGVSVTFAAPASGASATLTGSPAVTGADGQASVTATAGTVAGSYVVVAAAANVTTAAAFTLTNTQTLKSPGPTPTPPQSPTPSPSTTQPAISINEVVVTGGASSLRAAIAYANSHPGPDTIIFDPAVFARKHRTIRIVGGPLVVTDPATTTIIGPGARLLTLKGNGRSRVFDVRGGSLALSGLTIAGGRDGGIRNDDGMLSLTDVGIRGNLARGVAGLFSNGTAVLTDVVIAGNSARVGSGLFSTRSATLTWRRSPAGGRG